MSHYCRCLVAPVIRGRPEVIGIGTDGRTFMVHQRSVVVLGINKGVDFAYAPVPRVSIRRMGASIRVCDLTRFLLPSVTLLYVNVLACYVVMLSRTFDRFINHRVMTSVFVSRRQFKRCCIVHRELIIRDVVCTSIDPDNLCPICNFNYSLLRLRCLVSMYGVGM